MLGASIVADDATVLAADRYDTGDEMNGDLCQKGAENPNPFPSAIFYGTNILRSGIRP